MAESLVNEPVLFAPNLPSTINYEHLWTMFRNLLVTRITLSAVYRVLCPTKEGWSRLLMHGLQTAKIEFADIAQAEKAYTKMNFRPIPNIFPPEILKLSTSPDTEIPALPRQFDVDGRGSGRRTSSPSLDAVGSQATDGINNPIEIHEIPQITKEGTPHVDSLQGERTRVDSLLKQAEIDRDLWRRELDMSQSRIKVLEFQMEEERKKAAKEMASQRDAADRIAREQARKDALVTEIERCRQRDASLCKWERSAAMKRFLLVLDEFEGRKRPDTRPLTFEGIPWPTLDNPMVSSFQANAVTWEKVEAFFSYVKHTMLYHEYGKLVERVHRLFHPDKWRARRVLESVSDVVLRQAVEQSVNIVAQAMTPIWKESKGRA